MFFHVMTLFPEMINDAAKTSIIGRALSDGLISLEAVNIRDFTNEKHGKVDDYPYGGGAGMLMQAQPIYDCFMSIVERIGHRPRCIYLTPQAKVFTQQCAVELSKEEHLVLLCGHYEGVDERVLEEIVTDYISIGDYVLTGGELPALVLIDAISRNVPMVLSNTLSGHDESLENGLLEYPQYTRPAVWMDKEVPAILLSGDHEKVNLWRKEQSVIRTKERRPDLLERN